MMEATELLFLGLPETGKTTFLVALDEVLLRQTDEHGLVSEGFATSRTYIETEKAAWRAGRKVSHTSRLPDNEPVELHVRERKSGTTAHLVAPDVNGEFFESQWADRRWPVSYRVRLASISGLLVFVHACMNGRNPEMNEAWKNLQDSQPKERPTPWTAKGAAQQVKLVDILQCLVEYGRPRLPLPVAVMVSAWDLVEERDAPRFTPEGFLEREWSLLSQYLLNNSELFRCKVYGVSGRGGDDMAQAELTKYPPHERVWLKDGTSVTKDLTRPVRWLLGWK